MANANPFLSSASLDEHDQALVDAVEDPFGAPIGLGFPVAARTARENNHIARAPVAPPQHTWSPGANSTQHTSLSNRGTLVVDMGLKAQNPNSAAKSTLTQAIGMM